MGDWIEQVKERADLVEVVSRYTKLRKAGREFKGLCPFHTEKTPSFFVVPDKRFYKCFGCGESGDVFSIVMKLDAIDFKEAARRLAADYGVEIRIRNHQHSREARSRLERQKQLAANPSDDALRQLGLDQVATVLGVGRVADESGETLLLPIYDWGEAPIGWLRYRLRFATDGALAATERIGLDSASAPEASDALFMPKDLRTQLVRFPLLVTDDPLVAARLYAAGWGAIVAPVHVIGTGKGPALEEEHVERLARLGCKQVFFFFAQGTGREERLDKLRAIHAAEPILVRHAIEPLLVSEGEEAHADTLTWYSELGGAGGLRSLLEDPSWTIDLFQARVAGVQQQLAKGRLSRAEAADKLRPTLQAALVAEDRVLYHAYLAWAGRALGIRDRREIHRLLQVTRPASPIESEVF